MKTFAIFLLGLSLTAFGADKTTAKYLQDISVTIKSDGKYNSSEGSGVIYTRKNKKGELINFVWTAAHVVENLRSERKILRNGRSVTVVEFKDAKIIKEIRQNGRTVGRLELDAEVIKYSDATNGHDLALLRIRKANFVTESVAFYLDDELVPLGTELYHVGSLLGLSGSNSMTFGIMSQHGRVIPSLNKKIFDQTTCTAFPGSSGGGVYLKGDGSKYVGMLVRGAGEGFNLIVPVRRMVMYCQKHKIMWSLSPKEEMPDRETVDKMPVENVPVVSSEKNREIEEQVEKMFPFMIRNVPALSQPSFPKK
jgi:hypothetical protein